MAAGELYINVSVLPAGVISPRGACWITSFEIRSRHGRGRVACMRLAEGFGQVAGQATDAREAVHRGSRSQGGQVRLLPAGHDGPLGVLRRRPRAQGGMPRARPAAAGDPRALAREPRATDLPARLPGAETVARSHAGTTTRR